MFRIFSILFSLLLTTTAFAAGPAVSELNGKLSLTSGDANNDSVGVVLGSLSIPWSHNYGIQLDAASGQIGGSSLQGMGAHIFRRDPEHYLLGAILSSVKWQSESMNRIGVEGEYYANSWTFSGTLGGQSGGIGSGSFSSANARYYFTPNTMLEAGLATSGSDGRFNLRLESTPFDELRGLGLFANLATGNDGYDQILVGIRYYFGAKKALIKRHRQDDPRNNLLDGLIGSFGEFGEASCETSETWDGENCVSTTPSAGPPVRPPIP